jgi:polysaccharide biosynthesis transport protein
MLALPPPDPAAPYANHELVPRIFNVLFKWRWIIVLCAVAVVVPVAVMTYLKVPKYQLSTKILLKSTRAQLALSLSAATERLMPWTITPALINSEIQILKSADLLVAAIEKSGYQLIQNPDPLPAERERALQALRLRLRIAPLPDSNVIEVKLEDDDPKQGSRLINALAQLYLKKHAALHAGSDNTFEFFAQQAKFHREKFDSVRVALEKFQDRDNIISINQEIELNLSRLTALEASQKDLQIEIDTAAKEIPALALRVNELPAEVEKERTVVVNPEILTMRTRLVDLERQRDELLQRYTTNHRFVVDKDKEIAALRQHMQTRDENILGSLMYSPNRVRETFEDQLGKKMVALEAMTAKRDAIAEEKRSYDARLDVLKNRSFELGRLRGDFDLARETYFMYEKKAEEARVSKAMDDERMLNAGIVQEAMPPIIPLPRGLLTAVAMSGIAGTALGVAVAFILEFLNLTVKDERDVERFLQVPVLATIRQF